MKPLLVTSQSYQSSEVFLDKSFHLKGIHNDENQNVLFSLNKNQSAYFYLQKGNLKISQEKFSSQLLPYMYGALNAPAELILGPQSILFLIIIEHFKVLNCLGGPIEAKGRLNYIDGCSDTLLISPSLLGEPCLNHLHFPARIVQSKHIHSSFRFGVVTKGEGQSVSNGETINLKSGDFFFIPDHVEHKFDTFSSSMDIIAFHPDTDFGPTNECHPMINKTILRP